MDEFSPAPGKIDLTLKPAPDQQGSSALTLILMAAVALILLAGGAFILLGSQAPPLPSLSGDGAIPAAVPALSLESSVPNALKAGEGSSFIVDVKLNEPIELDGMTKNGVLELRKSMVEKYKLTKAGYLAYSPIFGQIEDNAPWWGIEGQFCKGAGQNSIDGASEESRDIINPYLLLVLDETMIPMTPGFCSPYPRPVSLEWDSKNSVAFATYDMSGFISGKKAQMKGYVKSLGAPDGTDVLGAFNEKSFYMGIIGLNARDFGYQYVSIDLQESEGISPYPGGTITSEPVGLLDFLHRGGSCGYNGGCNNLSPLNQKVMFSINKVPGAIHFKLWKNKPQSASEDADFTFIIRMV